MQSVKIKLEPGTFTDSSNCPIAKGLKRAGFTDVTVWSYKWTGFKDGIKYKGRIKAMGRMNLEAQRGKHVDTKKEWKLNYKEV